MSRLLAVLAVLMLSACAALKPSGVRPVLCAEDWVSFDGKTMPWQSWAVPSGTKPRGIVIAVHGLSGAKSDFWFLGQELPKRGYTVYAYDLRGQGNDPVIGERGDITGQKVWKRDLATFHALVKRRHPKVPVFWYGESLGSLIALHTAADLLGNRSDPEAIILASPVAGLRQTISGFQRFLLETAAKLSPRTRYTLGELAGVDEKKIQVTSNSTHGGQMAVTPHHVGAFSLRLLTTIGEMLDENPDAVRDLKMPVLFVASPNDVMSSADQIQGLFAQVRSRDKKLLWYTRSYHLLLHDVQRQEVVNDVARWLDRQVKDRER
ncbi:MAG: alpha/beta fold hydrolase [Prosthecobacter sp.]|jgi:acylglycerol lipase|uniref:alpha/beta fold hydrolase n=1 Tax=Prosthecobacter sp. TaxID=1965333 RepID=UPI0019F9995E|nr:alpha/beta fold hydrolase [Prosthecobacter sp.]MBE2285025.1 alpha/beta fold hydrolase [Prosthecobacter sp.]